MAALVCDICGGKLIIGSGGIAICDSCGMEHSVDRMKEKVQEIKGTVSVSGPVQVDTSHLVENYLRMAENAESISNHAEAESYCNKILEVEPNHYQAWLLKGKAAGWQSTLGNLRLTEAANAFIKAYEFAPEDKKRAVADNTSEQISNLSTALISLRCERFQKWPDKEEALSFGTDLTEILSMRLLFTSGTGVVDSTDNDELAQLIYKAVTNAVNNKILPDYRGQENHPTKNDLETYITRSDCCIAVLELVLNLCNPSAPVAIQIYEKLIYLQKELIDSCAYSYETVKKEGSFWNDYQPIYVNEYVKCAEMTASAKKAYRTKIREYEEKISSIKAEQKAEAERLAREEAAARQAAIKAFWDINAEFKSRIQTEITELKALLQKIREENADSKSIPLIEQQVQNLENILTADRAEIREYSPEEQETVGHICHFRESLNSYLAKEQAQNKAKHDFWSLHAAEKTRIEEECKKAADIALKCMATSPVQERILQRQQMLQSILAADRTGISAFTQNEQQIIDTQEQFWLHVDEIESSYKEYIKKCPLVLEKDAIEAEYDQVQSRFNALGDDIKKCIIFLFLSPIITPLAVLVVSSLQGKFDLTVFIWVSIISEIILLASFILPNRKDMKEYFLLKRTMKKLSKKIKRIKAYPKFDISTLR